VIGHDPHFYEEGYPKISPKRALDLTSFTFGAGIVVPRTTAKMLGRDDADPKPF